MGLSHRISIDPTLLEPHSVLVGGIATPIHLASECLLTASNNMVPSSEQHQSVWVRSLANNSTSRRKIQSQTNLLHLLQSETSLFRQTSVFRPQLNLFNSLH
ncbi:hypothetical protein AVEN_64330-1 [Araneus ventricosus]|uniref:Uncharacterized protein n=1 Tax=Araneus ventricosus TaxID=182803 RepID=A0A4Y2D8H8_ARAVE|nr:hypothetical protein AVEN_64330-1 [Araneus ventricosus]